MVLKYILVLSSLAMMMTVSVTVAMPFVDPVCTCPDGYKFNTSAAADDENPQCIDDKECDRNNGGCSQNCTNTEGSFECNCRPFFRLNVNGKDCDCLLPFILSPDGSDCGCPDGHIPDGGDCIMCPPGTIPDGGDCIGCPDRHIPNPDQSSCEMCPSDSIRSPNGSACMRCPPGTIPDGGDCITCPPGTIPDGGDCITCPPGTIPDGGDCITCPPGTIPDGGDCIGCPDRHIPNPDQTGCEMCPSDSIRSPNGSACMMCPSGTRPNADGTECTDGRRCERNNGGCSQICENTKSSVICSCQTFFNLSLDGKTCVCLSPLVLSPDGTACVCPAGSRRSPDGTCITCPPGTVPEGTVCIGCPDRHIPNPDQSSCEMCPSDSIRSPNGISCTRCPSETRPNDDGTECIDDRIVPPSPPTTSGPGTTPTSDPGTTPTSDPGTTPTSDPGTTPTSDPGTTPTSDPGTTPTSDPGTTPTSDSGTTPTSDPGTTPTSDPGTTPTSDPGTTPTSDPGTTPTSDPGTTPTSDPGTTPTSDPGMPPSPTPGPPKPPVITGRCSAVVWSVSESSCEVDAVTGYEVEFYVPGTSLSVIRTISNLNIFHYVIQNADLFGMPNVTLVRVRARNSAGVSEWSESVNIGCVCPTVTQCPTGYRANGKECEDINECTDSADNGGCSQICTNTEGSFECRCFTGYTLESDGKTCIDIDECAEGTANCIDGAVCVNLPGGYRCDGCVDCVNGAVCVTPMDEDGFMVRNSFCSCQPGFEGDGRASGTGCTDINECTDGTAECQQGFECFNRPGSYECRDIDECTDGTAKCEEGFECFNTHGSYECRDIDECTSNTASRACVDGTTCVNNVGSFNCTACPSGFEGDGRASGTGCKDIDECAEGTDTRRSCLDNYSSGLHKCLNTIGSYICQNITGPVCNITDGAVCSQICTDLEPAGEYECSCRDGYTLDSDNKTCNDIDECVEQTHNCTDDVSRCRNTVGGFECDALSFYLNGIKYTNNSKISLSKITNGENGGLRCLTSNTQCCDNPRVGNFFGPIREGDRGSQVRNFNSGNRIYRGRYDGYIRLNRRPGSVDPSDLGKYRCVIPGPGGVTLTSFITLTG